jgi:hypothetical protein
MKRIWINKADSLEAAHNFDVEYYKALSNEARVETLQLLREMHFKSMGMQFCEDGKRLRRVLRIIRSDSG